MIATSKIIKITRAEGSYQHMMGNSNAPFILWFNSCFFFFFKHQNITVTNGEFLVLGTWENFLHHIVLVYIPPSVMTILWGRVKRVVAVFVVRRPIVNSWLLYLLLSSKAQLTSSRLISLSVELEHTCQSQKVIYELKELMHKKILWKL